MSTSLAAGKFDAFISYAGGTRTGARTPDGRVAEALHRQLEAYRAPARRGEPGGRRVRKVFRDRDELRATHELAGSLRDALRRSEYLIVVCSPRARASEWVNREIRAFVEDHRPERILLLLVEGEPADAFPPALDDVAPAGDGRPASERFLAADVRAPSVRASLGLLKREKLRLLAPMLGYEFDDLRQRQHERRVRRLAALAAASLAAAVLLTVLSAQLFLARRRAQSNYDLALASAWELASVLEMEDDTAGSRYHRIAAALEAAEGLKKADPRNPRASELVGMVNGLMLGEQLVARDSAAVEGVLRRIEAEATSTALNRLRRFDPNAVPAPDSLVFPDEAARLVARQCLATLEPGLSHPRVPRWMAEGYAGKAVEYLYLLDMQSAPDRAEARRVLEVARRLLSRSAETQPPGDESRRLVDEIDRALRELGG